MGLRVGVLSGGMGSGGCGGMVGGKGARGGGSQGALVGCCGGPGERTWEVVAVTLYASTKEGSR